MVGGVRLSSPQRQARLARLRTALRSRTGLRIAVIGLLVVLLAGVVILLNRRYAGRLAVDPRYQVTLEVIHITPPPQWIDAQDEELKAQAAQLGSLPPKMDLRQPQLTVQIAEAFRKHPWVHEVRQVIKRYPARVNVELDYRQPVAMVEVPLAASSEGGLLPVDIHGICLPTEDFSPEEAQSYPRIRYPGTQPQTNEPGYPWGDVRVSGAARIAAALQAHWDDLPFRAVVVPSKHPPKEGPGAFYEIVSQDGPRIIWGHPPGEEFPGERLAPEKVTMLLRLFDPAGTQPRSLPETIDLTGRIPSFEPPAQSHQAVPRQPIRLVRLRRVD